MTIKQKLIIVLRWIAVLPTFLVAYVIVYAIMSFSYRFYADENSIMVKFALPIIGSFVSGISSIVYAAKMAPSYKRYVGAVLLGLMLLCSGVLLFFGFEQAKYLNMIAIAASLVGNIIGYQMSKDEQTINEL